MITDGFFFLATLIGIAAILVYLEKRRGMAVFKYVPGFVFLYLIAATLNTLGVFGQTDSIDAVGSGVKDALLPAMIMLLLFQCDVRQIIKLGPKLMLTYTAAVVSIFAGFVVAFLLFRGLLDPEAWKGFAALAGSWTGGSANMVAVQEILQAPESLFGQVLIVDTIVYSLWLLLMFSGTGIAKRFNAWVKADTSYLETQVAAVTNPGDTSAGVGGKNKGGGANGSDETLDQVALFRVIALGLFASAAATWVGNQLPQIGVVVTSTTWTILIVSVLGLIIGSTRFGKMPGASEVSHIMLYIIIGIIAAGSDFSSLVEAPLYLLAGFVVVTIHLLLMVVYAKLTRTELFSLAVASTANIGGVASAPVVASAYSQQLVPVGVLYALIGAFAGTFFGLATGQILSMLS
ncbi:DUF819 family protein [Brevibacterium paucivorans]|uniref:DUF819 family protein n=1 Tax=Brevibacterium paucivorans TaxID=170994 RepID=UPI0031E190FF